jgi:hypothetical protein
MTYLTEEDLTKVISDYGLKAISNDKLEVTLTRAEQLALETVHTHIGNLYDLEAEFSQTGDARNATLLGIVGDIMIYQLIHTLEPQKVPAPRVARYMEAKEMLAKMSRGELTPRLSPKVGEDGTVQPDTFRRFGNRQEPRNNSAY